MPNCSVPHDGRYVFMDGGRTGTGSAGQLMRRMKPWACDVATRSALAWKGCRPRACVRSRGAHAPPANPFSPGRPEDTSLPTCPARWVGARLAATVE